MNIPIEVNTNGYIPYYTSRGAAGADLYATDYITVGPNAVTMVDTQVKIAIPTGHVGMVVSRSGLAYKKRVIVLNAPGIVDEDYRGSIGVLLWNTHPKDSFHAHPGDRIAQLLIVPVKQATFTHVDNIDATERGAGGFGSTGVGNDN